MFKKRVCLFSASSLKFTDRALAEVWNSTAKHKQNQISNLQVEAIVSYAGVARLIRCCRPDQMIIALALLRGMVLLMVLAQAIAQAIAHACLLTFFPLRIARWRGRATRWLFRRVYVVRCVPATLPSPCVELHGSEGEGARPLKKNTSRNNVWPCL